ncbi:hypothetical protein [Bacillus smithii]|uniref:hypothetical protein n=1 Tax=Bacillus smithii TaxID=1479 RepID=UPI002E1BFFF8|nr:hypothetical protein [Bacillus smithii]MED4929041.1 hypothetical protein [Bacillus smithii]
MKTLTFAFDVQLNGQDQYIPKGTVVKISNTHKQNEGFVPVVITEVKSLIDNKIVKIDPTVEYFFSFNFKELL